MRARIATAILALVSTALALVAAELVVRRVRSDLSDRPSEFLIPHPTLGWSRPPGARFHYVIDGRRLEVAYNARGFHDVERAPGPAAGGVRRVVVLGDSFMEAYGVALDDTFSRQLEAHLLRNLAAGGPVEVVNLGVSGYGTLQQALVYQLEGRASAPALVLLGFYLHNDLSDNSLEIESLRKPGSPKATDRPFLLPGADPDWQLTEVGADRALARYQTALARRRSWWWRAGEVSQLWRLTGAAWIGSALRALDEARDPDFPGGAELPRRERIALELDVFSCHPRAEYDRAWDVTARILARLARDVRGAGAELVVFSVPSVYESEASLPDAESYDLTCRDAPPGYARLREILAGLAVPYIDLLPAFQHHARELSEPLFAGDSHWNAAGHALAAAQVARGLAEIERAQPGRTGLSPDPPDPGRAARRSDPATPPG